MSKKSVSPYPVLYPPSKSSVKKFDRVELNKNGDQDGRENEWL